MRQEARMTLEAVYRSVVLSVIEALEVNISTSESRRQTLLTRPPHGKNQVKGRIRRLAQNTFHST